MTDAEIFNINYKFPTVKNTFTDTTYTEDELKALTVEQLIAEFKVLAQGLRSELEMLENLEALIHLQAPATSLLLLRQVRTANQALIDAEKLCSDHLDSLLLKVKKP